MKKLFFTAIALIAFSGISTANTIVLDEKLEVNSQELEKVEPCGTLTSVYLNGVFQGSYWTWTRTLTCEGLAFRDYNISVGTSIFAN
jgi:hypothetical protein